MFCRGGWGALVGGLRTSFSSNVSSVGEAGEVALLVRLLVGNTQMRGDKHQTVRSFSTSYSTASGRIVKEYSSQEMRHAADN